ncbi:MAG TPA: 30S ribosomal protein S8 [Opitutae bacterium]|nr:30S ribosomal protein S8 [Opitutae bacterium]|tara:strand:+ start:2975 stop:3376 length:402 start_codon:yes stop_codon:yes gene_type:complete
MAIHDTIGDFLTIIRNSTRAGKETCSAQWSKMREGIAKILKEEGFIRDYKEIIDGKTGRKELKLTLKYVDSASVIAGIERYSKPGCRIYSGWNEIPKVLGGLGITILTTSKGILKDADARRQKAGGEIIAKVW